MATQTRSLITQQSVLAAALPLFARKGNRTRIEDISAASGVSVGSIYHHFGNRDGIVDALYAQKLNELVVAISSATTVETDLQAGITAFISTHIRWFVDNQDAAAFIFGVGQFSPTSETLRRAATEKSEAITQLTRWYVARIEDGQARRIDPMILELLLVGPGREYCQRFLVGAITEPPEAVIPQLVDVVWQTVRV